LITSIGRVDQRARYLRAQLGQLSACAEVGDGDEGKPLAISAKGRTLSGLSSKRFDVSLDGKRIRLLRLVLR
jgi:hypothetical protein